MVRDLVMAMNGKQPCFHSGGMDRHDLVNNANKTEGW
jgi:hypothetical protein